MEGNHAHSEGASPYPAGWPRAMGPRPTYRPPRSPGPAPRPAFLHGPSVDVPQHEVTLDAANVLLRTQRYTVLAGSCRGVDVAVVAVKETATHDNATLREQLRIATSLYHPNVVLLLGASLGPEHTWLLQERCTGPLGSLLYGPRAPQLSPLSRASLCLDAAKALAWMHAQSPPIIHCSFGITSCWYVSRDDCLVLKVADFGVSAVKGAHAVGDDASHGSGGGGLLTPYMAPEVLSAVRADHGVQPAEVEALDVYAWAILSHEIATGCKPLDAHWKKGRDAFLTAVIDDTQRPSVSGLHTQFGRILSDAWNSSAGWRPTMLQLVERMEPVLVHVAVPEPTAARFWMHYFYAPGEPCLEVEWVMFVECFYEYLGLLLPDVDDNSICGYELWLADGYDKATWGDSAEEDLSQSGGGSDAISGIPSRDTIDYLVLKTLLVRDAARGPSLNDSKVVEAEQFGRIAACFGPLYDPQSDTVALLERLHALCAKRYFFGNMSSSDAVRCLLGCDKPAFLVRFSGNLMLPGFLVVSKITSKRRIIHVRVRNMGKGYYVDLEGMQHQLYASMDHLIAECKPLGLDACVPASGSKFWHLFAQGGDVGEEEERGGDNNGTGDGNASSSSIHVGHDVV